MMLVKSTGNIGKIIGGNLRSLVVGGVLTDRGIGQQDPLQKQPARA